MFTECGFTNTLFIRYQVGLCIVKRICAEEFKSSIKANKKGRWDVKAILYIYVRLRMFRERDEGVVFGSGNRWLCILNDQKLLFTCRPEYFWRKGKAFDYRNRVDGFRLLSNFQSSFILNDKSNFYTCQLLDVFYTESYCSKSLCNIELSLTVIGYKNLRLFKTGTKKFYLPGKLL